MHVMFIAVKARKAAISLANFLLSSSTHNDKGGYHDSLPTIGFPKTYAPCQKHVKKSMFATYYSFFGRYCSVEKMHSMKHKTIVNKMVLRLETHLFII